MKGGEPEGGPTGEIAPMHRLKEMIRFSRTDPFRGAMAPPYTPEMVRRVFLGLLASTSFMLVASPMRRVGWQPLLGLGAPRVEALGSWDIFLDRSRDFSDTHTWIAGGAPVDLTGCSASLAIRKAPPDAHPAIALSTTPGLHGLVALGGSLGTIHIRMTKVAMAALADASRASYALVIDFPNGMRTNLLEGRVHVNDKGNC
jgi:hypothetical protein